MGGAAYLNEDGGAGRSGLDSGRGVEDTSVLEVCLHRRADGSVRLCSERSGPAGCSSTRPLLLLLLKAARGSGGGRVAFRAGGRQLSSASAPSAAARPTFLRKPGSVQCRLGFGPLLRLLIFIFSAEKGRDCRKEGEEEENARGMMGNVVFLCVRAVLTRRSEDYISQHAPVDLRVTVALGSLAEY